MKALVLSRRPGAYILPRHKAVARTFGYALAADLPEAWGSFRNVLHYRLAPQERAALALMALMAVDGEDINAVLTAALGPAEGAGFPAAPFDDGLAEAELWAVAATPAELRAYVFTAFHALSRKDRLDFLAEVTGRAAA